MLKRSNKTLPAFLCCIYSFALGSIGIRARWIFVLMLIWGIVLIVYNRGRCQIRVNQYNINWYILTLTILLFIALPNARHASEMLNEIICLVIVSFIFTICVTNNTEIQKLQEVMVRAGIAFALYIAFFRAFKGLYFSLVLPHLTPDLAETVYMNMQFGYGPEIGNSSIFGDYMIMMGIAVTVGRDISTGKEKIKYKLLLIVLLCGILMEGRKGELLCSVLSIVIMYVLSKEKAIKNPAKKICIAIVILICIGLGFNYLYQHGYLQRFTVMLQRIQSDDPNAGDFSSGRIQLWKNAVDVFLKHPIWGVGWGRFANYATGIYMEVYEGQAIRDVHNVLLQLLCETGIVGTLMIVLPFMKIMNLTYKHFRKIKRDKFLSEEETCNNVFSLTIMIFFLLMCFFDPVIYGPFFWCVYAIAVIIESQQERSQARLLI